MFMRISLNWEFQELTWGWGVCGTKVILSTFLFANRTGTVDIELFNILFKPPFFKQNNSFCHPGHNRPRVVLGDLWILQFTMAENQNQSTPALHRSIRWNHYNYPPLLKLIHFSPSQVPRDRKFLVLGLFIIHLVMAGNSLINFVDSCFQGGLRVLYAFLFILFINPVMIYVFERGFTGICKQKGNLKVFFILQPILIVLQFTISITNAFGFNGFIRAHQLFGLDKKFAAILAVLVSIIFLATATFSTFILVRIFREKDKLTSDI